LQAPNKRQSVLRLLSRTLNFITSDVYAIACLSYVISGTAGTQQYAWLSRHTRNSYVAHTEHYGLYISFMHSDILQCTAGKTRSVAAQVAKMALSRFYYESFGSDNVSRNPSSSSGYNDMKLLNPPQGDPLSLSSSINHIHRAHHWLHGRPRRSGPRKRMFFCQNSFRGD
jgi:hypothetical protein